jgi:hypothetical protein
VSAEVEQSGPLPTTEAPPAQRSHSHRS